MSWGSDEVVPKRLGFRGGNLEGMEEREEDGFGCRSEGSVLANVN